MNINNKLLLAAALFSAVAHADVPVYRDQKLLLNNAAIVSENYSHYYRNVQLSMDGEGKLVVTSAEESNLAIVDSITVQIAESFPVQVSVRVDGILSVPCVALEEPAVSFKNGVFTVVLAEAEQAPDEVCVTIAAVTPFSIVIPLPVSPLAAGNYALVVNGVEAGFNLESDNP